MQRTFKYRLYPNRQQRETLAAQLDLCRELYNAALALCSWSTSMAIHVRWSGKVLSRSLSPPGSQVTSPLFRADELSPTLEINNA
jgi:helix-turn-helix protein